MGYYPTPNSHRLVPPNSTRPLPHSQDLTRLNLAAILGYIRRAELHCAKYKKKIEAMAADAERISSSGLMGALKKKREGKPAQ